MPREVWVAGFPSFYGGADTELDHLIDLLVSYGVDVHLVPMFGCDERMKATVVERGCTVHAYRDDVFKDRTVVSFCNGRFLEHLPAIVEAGRPRRVIWFNCMTWLFEREKEAHRNGWIDYFGFQSQYQRNMLTPQLEQIAPVVRSFPTRRISTPPASSGAIGRGKSSIGSDECRATTQINTPPTPGAFSNACSCPAA